MKTKTLLICFACMCFLLACVSKPDPDWDYKGPIAAEDRQFFRGEKSYKSEKYSEALDAYTKYLAQYPNRSMAPAALLRIGYIHLAQDNFNKARDTFNQVMSRYSESPLIPEARIGILNSYYKEARFDQVIRLASGLLEQNIPDKYMVKAYIILGDTYVAMDSPEDSIYFYTMAVKRSDEQSVTMNIEKLRQAIELLEIPVIHSLLEHLEEKLPRSYLLYQLGIKYIKEEKYDQAVKALSRFVNQHPEHEYFPDAQDLLEEYSEKIVYLRTTVGCMLPLTGPYKKYGNNALKGIELALMQANSKGMDPPIELVIKDTGSNHEKAVEAVQALAEAKVAAIIGPIVTAETAAIAAQDNDIPIITVTQKDSITEIGDHVFRNFLTPEMQVKTIVSYATEELELKKFAILYPDEKYGRTFMNLFWDEVLNYGGQVVGLESYNPKHTDFAAPIKKLVGLYYEIPEDLKPEPEEVEDMDEQKDQNDSGEKKEEEPKAIIQFDAVFIPDSPNKAGLIIPQLAYYDVEDVYLLGTNIWHSPRLIEMARDYVQGAIMADGFFAESKAGNVKKFVMEFEGAYGKKPGFIEATTYDTARMLFKVITDPDVRSRNAIKTGLLDMKEFNGVTGMTSFQDNGDVWKKLRLLRVDGKKFIELKQD